MESSLKAITNIQRWRLTAITIGSALAMSLATTAFAAAPNLNSNGNASGTVGVAFTPYQIQANQAIPNGNWGATGLPPGLGPVSATGLITGTPTSAGPFTVHLTATNANGTGSKDVTFTIAAPPAPTIMSAGTKSGTVGDPSFSYQITANEAIPSGGWGTTVSIPGVGFSTATGLFSGTPTTAGTFSGNITATNANGTGTKT